MMKAHKFSLYVLVASAVTLAGAGQAGAAVMAYWDFGSGATFTLTPLIDLTGGATLQLEFGEVDLNGKAGVAYVNADGRSHAAGLAAAWDNASSESQLIITLNTTGWVNLIVRFDYKSENTIDDLGPIGFDMDYRVSPAGAWNRLLNNQPLVRDNLWHSFSYDITQLSHIENQPFVQLRINDLSQGDESGGSFTIDNVEITGTPIHSTILLLAPNAGESLQSGQTFDIRWKTTGPVNLVKLEYSVDNGAQWTEIATVANAGLFHWEVPDVTSAQCLVRVSNVANGQVFDISDAPFRIFRCLLNFDLNGDCYVDMRDLALLASEWLLCGDPFDPRCF